jgi:hypothetical protein
MDPGKLPAVQFFPGGSVLCGSRPGQKPNQHYVGTVVILTGHHPVGFWPGRNRTMVRLYDSSHGGSTLNAIEYVSSDRIMTWSISKVCSFMPSLTSRFKICEPTNIRWNSVKSVQICGEIRRFSIATQRILGRSHLCEREVKECIKLHNVYIVHVMIRLELRYLIWTKLCKLKCCVFGGKTGPIAMVQILVW